MVWVKWGHAYQPWLGMGSEFIRIQKPPIGLVLDDWGMLLVRLWHCLTVLPTLVQYLIICTYQKSQWLHFYTNFAMGHHLVRPVQREADRKWCIWTFYMEVNVGKYTIHGAFGVEYIICWYILNSLSVISCFEWSPIGQTCKSGQCLGAAQVCLPTSTWDDMTIFGRDPLNHSPCQGLDGFNHQINHILYR